MQLVHNGQKSFQIDKTSFDDVIVISMLWPYHHFNVWQQLQQLKKWKAFEVFLAKQCPLIDYDGNKEWLQVYIFKRLQVIS